MPANIVWSKLARQQLLDLYIEIGLHNPDAAERLYDRIENCINRLATHPRLGRRRAEIRPRTRALVQAPYLILYEAVPDNDATVQTVEIVAIVHGRRDLAALHPTE